MAMYLVVFRNRKRADIDGAAYAADAGAMEALAARQDGFIAFKSYMAADGEVVALSEWADEAAAVQAKGRAQYYESYTLFAGSPTRVHRFGPPQGKET